MQEVPQHDHRPVVAIKNVGQDVKEGGIYFRYVGETRLIKPGELRQIIAALRVAVVRAAPEACSAISLKQ